MSAYHAPSCSLQLARACHAVGFFSATGFMDELAAKATASEGKILLATLNDLYG
jgi:hypothetical protein